MSERSERSERLKPSWKARTEEAESKARASIQALLKSGKEVTFTSVHQHSGVSKNFLYNNQSLRAEIEECIAYNDEFRKARQAKRARTAKSRDTVIEAKDHKIKKLEEENERLRDEISALRAELYNSR